MIDKLNNNKLFEGFYLNGQLSFRFYMKEIKEIVKPQETYGNFYWLIFGARKEPNFLSTLQDQFRGQLKFLTDLGLEELANQDEILYDQSFKSHSVSLNCKSYHENGHLKFEYTFENPKRPFLDSGVESFELFYEDCQPKFRFRYERDEEDFTSGDYQMFYNNGQLKESGSLYSNSSFERFSKTGQIKEYYRDNEFYKYHDNEKVHYWITLKEGRKHGPFEIYNRFGEFIEKGAYDKDEIYDGPNEYYFEDGQLFQQCFYKNGLLEGSFEEYHPNGQLYRRCVYKNGLREGIFEEYYIFGELNFKRNYVNGKVQNTID